jgi:hypothetical protein
MNIVKTLSIVSVMAFSSAIFAQEAVTVPATPQTPVGENCAQNGQGSQNQGAGMANGQGNMGANKGMGQGNMGANKGMGGGKGMMKGKGAGGKGKGMGGGR